MKGVTPDGPGKWKLRWAVYEQGKRKQKQERFQGNKRQAEARLTEIKASVTQGTYREPTNLTVGEHLERWLETMRETIAGATYDLYTHIVYNRLIPRFGARKLEDLTPVEIQDFINHSLREGRQDGRPLSRQTVHHYARILRQALEMAVDQEIIPRNPAQKVRLPSPGQPEMAILSQDEVRTLLLATRGDAMWILAVLAIATGARRGELLALRWQDVDLEEGVITINRSLENTKRGGLAFKSPKTKAGRRKIRMPSYAVAALIKHRAAQAEHRLRTKDYEDNDLVIATRDGKPQIPSNASNWFAKAVKDAGVADVTLHGLRHTFASLSLWSGANMLTVSKMMGHKDIKITLGRYSHLLGDEQDRVAQAMDDILRDAGGM